jgi:hypothetical protein
VRVTARRSGPDVVIEVADNGRAFPKRITTASSTCSGARGHRTARAKGSALPMSGGLSTGSAGRSRCAQSRARAPRSR